MKLRSRVCPVCGSSDWSKVVAEANFDEDKFGELSFASRKTPEFMHFRMVRCPTCDLLYATPSPEPGWLRERYLNAGFDAAEESLYAALTYARHLGPIADRLPDRDGALDIGTGDGAFLEQLLEAGFAHVTGVEPSRAPAALARPAVRKLIRGGFFRSEDFENDSLSLVTCFQTLEHSEDPSGLCSDAHQLLKPGGALYVVAHNYRSLSARILGTRSPIYDIEHLQLNSRRSLRLMLERSGFVDVSVKSLRNSYPLSYWVKLLPFGSGLKNGIRSGLARMRRADPVLSMWAGNLVAVGYKPGAIVDKERSIGEFNKDVAAHDGYVYATGERLSCRLSNRRMTRAVVELGDLAGKRVIDIGCGDGTYSRELIEAGASQVLGIDAAEVAVRRAEEKFGSFENLRFQVCDVYALEEPEQRYDVAVLRGFLHHLYDVERAIDRISRMARQIVVVEPNGYNPVLKVIERVSPYHRKHEEKSYPPRRLDRWFEGRGGRVVSSQYIGLVPMFCPDLLARVCKSVEPLVERTPLLRNLCCAQYVQKISMS